MVEFEERLKIVVVDRVEIQIRQVCKGFNNKYINSSYADKGYGISGDIIGYYKSLTPNQKKRIKKSERMFIEDTITFFETEIKRFKGMNKIYEDKFAKYIVLSFV